MRAVATILGCGLLASIAGTSAGADAPPFVIRPSAHTTVSNGQALLLRDGEVWFVEVSRLAAKKVKFSSAMLGEREIEAAQVAAIDFVARPEAGASPGTMYREAGEPVPGTLLFVDPQRVTLESPLGIVSLSREGLLRYVFPEPKGAPAAQAFADEVRLIDGSIYKGKLAVGTDHVELEHAILGKVSVPMAAVRAIIHPGVAWVSELSVTPAELVAPVKGSRAAERILGKSSDDYLVAYRIEPKSTTQMRLPGSGRFQARLRRAAGSSGPVKVKVVAGTAVVAEQVLADAPLDVSVPNAREAVTIEVDFAGEVRFPCGVLVCDPALIAQP